MFEDLRGAAGYLPPEIREVRVRFPPQDKRLHDPQILVSDLGVGYS